MDNTIIKPGLYRHFKGGLYRVIAECIIADSNPGTVGVVYQNEAGDLFVRSLVNWIQPVVRFEDGTEIMCERFRYISA